MSDNGNGDTRVIDIMPVALKDQQNAARSLAICDAIDKAKTRFFEVLTLEWESVRATLQASEDPEVRETAEAAQRVLLEMREYQEDLVRLLSGQETSHSYE